MSDEFYAIHPSWIATDADLRVFGVSVMPVPEKGVEMVQIGGRRLFTWVVQTCVGKKPSP
jgi:hypothetical protein